MGASGVSAGVPCDTDFNGDGMIDEADLEILKTHIGSTDEDEDYAPAVDLDGDGVVGLMDFNLFLTCE